MKTESGVTTYYIYGLGLIYETTDTDCKVYHYDYRGSTVALTNLQGSVTDTFTYDTYGKLTTRTGTTATPFLYNGRDGVMSDENGLVYMRARYYSPTFKRFINADVVAGSITNSITLNRYAYANGNPVSNVDPFGLEAERGGSGKKYLPIAFGVDPFGNVTNSTRTDKSNRKSMYLVTKSDWHADYLIYEEKEQSFVKKAIKWLFSDVLDPAVEGVEYLLSKVDLTYTHGISVSGTPSGVIFAIQGGITIDTKGNIAIQGALSSGFTGGSPGFSIMEYQTITNASSFEKIEGFGTQIGGSLAYGVAVGADLNIMEDSETGEMYLGGTYSEGVGTPGGELHVEMGMTGTIFDFNIFEMFDMIYNNIMEW